MGNSYIMILRIIALCGYIGIICQIANTQSESKKKDVLIFDDTIFVTKDTLRHKHLEIKPIIKTDSLSSASKDSIDLTQQTQNQDSITTVIKGYSPFTNYTDTFNVRATSAKIKLNKTGASNTHDTLVVKPKIFKEYNGDDKFFYEFDFEFTKTSLAQAWNKYANQETADTNKQLSALNKEVNVPDNNQPNGELSNQQLVQVKVANQKTELQSEIQNASDSVEFYIQLAASRSPLTDVELTNLTIDHNQLRIIKENNWHKYQIPAGTDYLNARSAINNFPNKNSFLVAYRGIERLSLWETVKHIELHKPMEPELTFVIQLAASRKPLSYEEKEKLNTGFDQIRIKEEEGWFKYQIVIGPSYSLAIEKWKLIGKTISFPVAYLNGEKIEMTEALKKIR